MAKVITLAQIAELTGGSVVGDPEIKISSISDPRRPKDGAISPLWEKKLEKFAAGCPVLFTKKGWVKEGQSGVELDEPRAGLIALLKFFDEAPERERTVSERALVDKDARLGENVAVGAGSVIKAGASVGDGTVIMENVFIDCGVIIGKNCVIEPGAVVFHHSVLGDGCVLHANAVVGCDGFGFLPNAEGGFDKIPQVGNVVIEDDVEIGANTCIDRAKTDSTIIRRGVKLDNLIQVGHNVEIGENTVSSAQMGIAGTSKIGRNCFLAGQVGIADHVKVGARVRIGSKTGLDKDVPDGEIRFGYPALPGMQYHRSFAVFKNLPDLAKRVAELEKAVKEGKEGK